MSPHARRLRSWALGLLLLGGCCYPVRDNTDCDVDALVRRPLDLAPPVDTSVPADRAARPPAEKDEQGGQAEGRRGRPQPLKLPPGLPGAEAPPIFLPPRNRAEALRRLYPELPPVGPDPVIEPGPNGRPLTLSELQRLAMANNPTIRQAASDVQAARGAAIKAAAYPNPTVGFETDNVGTGIQTPGAGAGYWGGFFDQVIKTGGKQKLAWASAMIDLYSSQLALRRAQTDTMALVRGGYFAVLVARENIRINKLLVELTDRAFRVQLELARAGAAATAAPYEPMAMRVLAYQARVNLLTARNRYTSAWKQLAAALGLTGMKPTELAGRVDMPMPVYDFRTVLARVLSSHTDVLTAQDAILKARYNLRLAQVTPVPDIEVRVLVQKDWTTPPFLTTPSVQVSGPIPVWDTNKGGIVQAQAALLRAIEEPHRVRTALTQTLADAFERYQTNRRTIQIYRNRILPDQVRVYQGVLARRNQAPAEVGFADVVTAQQGLAAALTTYVATLALQWQAVVDVANVLQTNDLFQVGGEAVERECVAVPIDLERLWHLPCCHPSSPAPDPQLKGGDGGWPDALPHLGRKERPARATGEGDESRKRPGADTPAPRQLPDADVLAPEKKP